MKNMRSSLIFGIGVTIYVLMLIMHIVLRYTGHTDFSFDPLFLAIPIVMMILGGLPKPIEKEVIKEVKEVEKPFDPADATRP